jgi:hypothetical protein
MAAKIYYGGFIDDRLDTTRLIGESPEIPAVYLRKKDTEKIYQDVRPVRIVQVKARKVRGK